MAKPMLRTLTAFRATRWYREYQRTQQQTPNLVASSDLSGANLTEQVPGVPQTMKRLVYATLQALVKEGFDAQVVEALLDPDTGNLRIYVDEGVQERASGVENVLRRFGRVERVGSPADDPELGVFSFALAYDEAVKGKADELPDLEDEGGEPGEGSDESPAGKDAVDTPTTAVDAAGGVTTDLDAQKGGGVIPALGKQDGTLQVTVADDKAPKNTGGGLDGGKSGDKKSPERKGDHEPEEDTNDDEGDKDESLDEFEVAVDDNPTQTGHDDFDFSEPEDPAVDFDATAGEPEATAPQATVAAVDDGSVPIVAVDGVEVPTFERRKKTEGAGVAAYADDPSKLAYKPGSMSSGDKDEEDDEMKGASGKRRDEESGGKDNEMKGNGDEHDEGDDGAAAPGPDVNAALAAVTGAKKDEEGAQDFDPEADADATVVKDGNEPDAGGGEGIDWMAVADALIVLSQSGVLSQITGGAGGQQPGADAGAGAGDDGAQDEIPADDAGGADDFDGDGLPPSDGSENDGEDAEFDTDDDDSDEFGDDDDEEDDEFESEEDPEGAKGVGKEEGDEVPEEKPKQDEAGAETPTIAGLRQITQAKQAGKVGGQMVDLFSASTALAVYDAADDGWKAKLGALPVTKLVQLAFKVTKHVGSESVRAKIERAEKLFESTRRRGAPRKAGMWARIREGMPAVAVRLNESRAVVGSRPARAGLKAARVVLLGLNEKKGIVTFASRPDFKDTVYNTTLADWRRFAEAEGKADDEKKDDEDKKNEDHKPDCACVACKAKSGKEEAEEKEEPKDDEKKDKPESVKRCPLPFTFTPSYGQRVYLKQEMYSWPAGIYEITDSSFAQGMIRVRPLGRADIQIPQGGVPLPLYAFEGLVEDEKDDDEPKDDEKKESMRSMVSRIIVPQQVKEAEGNALAGALGTETGTKPSLADVNNRVTNAGFDAIDQGTLDRVWDLSVNGQAIDSIRFLIDLPKPVIQFVLNRQGVDG